MGQAPAVVQSGDGIRFRARLAKVDETGSLRDRLSTARGKLKAELLRAVSSGFQPIEAEATATGFRRKAWRWFELSTVTVPACEGARIEVVTRLGRAVLAKAQSCSVVLLHNAERRRMGLPPGRVYL